MRSLMGIALTGMLLCSLSPMALSAGGPPSAKSAYFSARMMLGASAAKSDDDVTSRLASAGLKHVGQAWLLASADASVQVTGDAAEHFFFVTYTPSNATSTPVPNIILEHADRVEFSGPDETMFVFKEPPPTRVGEAPASKFEEWVYVSVATGAWLRTTTFISFR